MNDTIWARNPQGDLKMFIGGGLILGIILFLAVMQTPIQARRPLVWLVTFLSGGFMVAYTYWPKPINFDPKTEIPANGVESVGSFLQQSFGVVSSFVQIIAAFLLGLGIFSLLRIHLMNIARKKKDWAFSVILLVAMFSMITFGYADFMVRQNQKAVDFDDPANWHTVNMIRDFLFDGLLQQMDAAMFSIIAFFILSAAYRAFRARSVEATILLGTALLVILSLMGVVAGAWDDKVVAMAGTEKTASADFLMNFKITEVAGWLKNTFQTPAITGIKFGIGLGTISMALRIWLGLEKGGKA
ncbi:MAG: hypothetical protein WCK51_10715 [Armatimonadota bacterium]